MDAGRGGSRRRDRMLRIGPRSRRLVAGGTGIERFADRALDGVQSIGDDGGEYTDEPSVGIIATAQLASEPDECGGQVPVLERRAVPQRTGLVHQDRQIMPGVVGRPVATEEPAVIGNDLVADQAIRTKAVEAIRSA